MVRVLIYQQAYVKIVPDPVPIFRSGDPLLLLSIRTLPILMVIIKQKNNRLQNFVVHVNKDSQLNNFFDRYFYMLYRIVLILGPIFWLLKFYA